MKPIILISLIIIIVFSSQAYGRNLQEISKSVVNIYVTHKKGVRQGSGFYISEFGQILSVYHLVLGAKEIKVFDKTGRKYTDIGIEILEPRHDLVKLRILDNTLISTPFLSLKGNPAKGKREIDLIGHPRGIPFQRFIGTLISENIYLDSLALTNENHEFIFSESIQIIPIDVTNYSGLSGAPVLQDGKAIGIFSGSLNEGGGIGWAIPNRYMRELNEKHSNMKRPSEIKEWDSLYFLNENLRGFMGGVRNVKVDSRAQAALDRYITSVKELEGIYSKLQNSAANARNVSTSSIRQLSKELTNKEFILLDDLPYLLQRVDDVDEQLPKLMGKYKSRNSLLMNIDSNKLILKGIVENRIEGIDNQRDINFLRAALNEIINSDNKASQMVDAVFLNLLHGRQEYLDTRDHLGHLKIMKGANEKELDKEIRTILGVAFKVVKSMDQAFQAMNSSELIENQNKQIKQLLGIGKVSEMIIYNSL